MPKEKQGHYPAVQGVHRHVSADTLSSASEEALTSEGRGVQEDALMSGGVMGVEEGTTGAPPLRDYPRAQPRPDQNR